MADVSSREQPFLTALAGNRLLCDGATGTMLQMRGAPPDACLEALNLTNPDLVRGVHADYVAAGADIIETNTFGANRVRLAIHGLADQVREINLAGARLARQAADAASAAGRQVFVAGSVGPLGPDRRLAATVATAPGSEEVLSPQEVRQVFREQIAALAEGGVDLVMLETFTSLRQLEEAMRAARAACSLPIIAQMSLREDGHLASGETAAAAAQALLALGVAVVGLNCVEPELAVRAVAEMAQVEGVNLSAQPNAGLPRLEAGGRFYPETAASFAAHAQELLALGTAIIGGCCGTTPEYVAAMRRILAAPAAVPVTVVERGPAPPVVEAPPLTLRQKLAAGRFVVTVEVDPPRGLNPQRALAGAALLRDAGADCLDIADSPMARARMSPIALAALIQRQVGIETIVHLTSRDRNLMALQADLLGAHALGLRNVLALKGDPITRSDYARATAVWDVDTVGLIRLIKGLNAGVDWAGNDIGRPASFFVGAPANPVAKNMERELASLRRKVEAGADFLMTQPVYDLAFADRFLAEARTLGIPVLLGVMPLHSSRHAEFLHREVRGIRVPEEVRERLRLAGDRALAEGCALAGDLMALAKSCAAGVYLVPSFGRYDVAAELVAGTRA